MYRWAPKIDHWIPENVNLNNTTANTTSYDFVPKINDMQTGQEMEEEKYNVTGHGEMTLKQIKEKIINALQGMLDDAKSDDLPRIEKLHHGICLSPELNNLVKQYSDHCKERHTKEKLD